MALQSGTSLGPYRIVGEIGAGGMGVVYRATDTRLSRDVAIKVLPDDWAADRDRMSRFQREAQVLASLNHPQIAAIYGFEESGPVRALVMELVEGPTLAERISARALPLDEVLSVARQLAEAIEYAHERGVIHRDLKPGNIKLTADGHIKVLDFGLAKAIAPTDAGGSAQLANSPTLSLAATAAGMILGTAAYMAPEQAKGKSVDRRADIWAFGVVLYEMLIGRMPFAGETISETMAFVMTREPDWSALPADTPPRFRELLRRCLVKDPRGRLRDIGDARILIEETIAHPTAAPDLKPAVAVPPTARLWRVLPWSLAALGVTLAAVTGLGIWPSRHETLASGPGIRLTTDLAMDASLAIGAGPAAILSPDGTTLAYVAAAGGRAPQIYLRDLSQLNSSPLGSTEGARNAFFSPDGQWIGFFADGKLKKISTRGGTAITIASAPDDRGGTWTNDGFIVFGSSGPTGLLRVPEAGGSTTPFTELVAGERSHRWPQVLPGDRGVLFTVTGESGVGQYNVAAQDLRSGERKELARLASFGRYLPTGHLVYLEQSTLFAAPFDLDRLALIGNAVPILEGVFNSIGPGAGQIAFSDVGSMVYIPGQTESGVGMLWLESSGKTTPVGVPIATYRDPRLSPDGQHIAVSILQTSSDIWVYDTERNTRSRLTFSPESEFDPVWTPDGARVAFGARSRPGPSAAAAGAGVYWKRADGTGEVDRLTDTSGRSPMSWHPSGRFLAVMQLTAGGVSSADVQIVPLEPTTNGGWKAGTPFPFAITPFAEMEPGFSPDGRWLAYLSDETGQPEVYVRSFPGPGGRWQVSTSGGFFPTWSKNGRELFFRTPTQHIMVVSVGVKGDSLALSAPRRWTEFRPTDLGPTVRNFDVHPDGQRLLVLKAPNEVENARPQVVFVSNFFDELRRLVPAASRVP